MQVRKFGINAPFTMLLNLASLLSYYKYTDYMILCTKSLKMSRLMVNCLCEVYIKPYCPCKKVLQAMLGFCHYQKCKMFNQI